MHIQVRNHAEARLSTEWECAHDFLDGKIVKCLLLFTAAITPAISLSGDSGRRAAAAAVHLVTALGIAGVLHACFNDCE